jgi:hypothetical protein
MTCLEAQGLTTPFLNDKLDLPKLEEFLDHVNHCDDCKEELEVYYILFASMKLLDEDRNFSNNFHLNFENKLKKAEERIIKKKINLLQKRVLLVAAIIVIAFVSSLGLEDYFSPDILPSNITAGQENYKVQNYFYENRTTSLDELYYSNYNTIIEKINAIKGETDEQKTDIN